MPYTDPTSLAIVACPGGEAFADEVITHLKQIGRASCRERVSEAV